MSRTEIRTQLDRIASRMIFAGLLLFPAIMILPVSGKAVNNVAYGLIILPALLWLLSSPKAAIDRLGQAKPVWLFLCCVLVISLINQQLGHAKVAGFVMLFCVAILFVLDRHPKALTLAFCVLACVSTLLLGWVGFEWLSVYLSTGESVRLTLWGRAENPIYAGLLVVSGFVFVWQHFVVGQLDAVYRQAIFGMILLLLCLAAIIIFQARTAMIGLLACLAGFLYLKRQFKYVILLFLVLGLAVFLTGTTEALLNRGLSYRPEIWLDVFDKMRSQCSFLAGCGQTEELFLNQFKGTHSGYVGTIYRHGIIAGAVFLYFAFWYFYQGLRTASPWFVVSLVGWGGMLTAMDSFVGSPNAWWVFFWMPTMAAIHQFQQGRV